MVLCQWTAWRFRLPALVLLSLCGIILGPVCGIISPEAFFGKNLAPLCSLAVAVILFEGGMNLHFAELHSTKKAALGMIVFGAPLGWALISSGISLKNPVNSKVLNEMFTATYGRISPNRVPRIPINESIRYTGNSST